MTANAPRLPFAASLDPKRIVATSAAIAVHAVVLMMLLMPMQVADPPARSDTDMIVVDVRPVPPVIPPPLRDIPPRPVTRLAPPVRQPVPVQTLNDDPRPIDPVVEEVTLEEPVGPGLEVDPQPSYAAIQADVAPAPPYPAQSIRLQQAGQVMLRVRVDEQGRAAEVVVESSSGFRLLDEAAIKTVKKRWHFVPATRDGRPVEAWALVPIVFQLDR